MRNEQLLVCLLVMDRVRMWTIARAVRSGFIPEFTPSLRAVSVSGLDE